MSRKRPLASSESLAPRALSPLLIPDAVPIPWDDDAATRYGVGNAAINGGLSVLVLPYEGMALGDNVEVHWDASGSPFASVVIDAGTLNQTLVLKLPEARFVAGDFQPFYRIRRESELDVDSPVRDIRVQLSVPGGQDPDPSTPHNENLHAPQVPQAILDNGVDAAQAEQGVDVTLAAYANMAEYDLIDFSWGGQPVRHTVQPGEVGRDIVLHIGKSTILAAGDGQVMLEYRVIDAAANRSEGWSLVTEVPVLAGGAVLDAPIVEGVVNGELDLNGLAGQDVTVEVLAVGASFSVGDSVELTWAGRTAGGLSVDWSDSLPVASVPQIMQFKVPYASVAAIVQGHAVVSYVLRKADGENLVSKRTQVDVTGTERSLPAPGVREASNGSLAANVTQATVEIPAYPGMAVGDLLTLVWSGEKADGQLTDYRPSHVVSSADVGKTVLVAVAGSQYVAPLDGGKVTLWYEVSPFDGQARLNTVASERLTLTVGSAAASLPAPRVLEASNDVLASDVLQATAEIAPYSGMAVGDRIDLFWRGDVSGETTAWLPIGSATVGLAVTFSVYPEDIAPNSSAEVSYRVTRAAGAVDDSAALQLRIGEALPLPAPSIDEAVGDQLDPSDVPNGATVRIDMVANLQPGDLLTLHWQGTAGAGTRDFIHPVSSNDVGKDLTLIVPFDVVQANEGESITLGYDVERFAGGREQSESLTLNVGSILPSLDAPSLDEALDGVLYLNLLPVSGATARIAPYPRMEAGERITIFWRTQSLEWNTAQFVAQDQVDEDQLINIPYGVLLDSLDRQVAVSYTVERANSVIDSSYTAWVQVKEANLGRWETRHPMRNQRSDHALHLLDDGSIMAIDSHSASNGEVYHPIADDWIFTSSFTQSKSSASLTVSFPNGVVLATSSEYNGEIYYPTVVKYNHQSDKWETLDRKTLDYLVKDYYSFAPIDDNTAIYLTLDKAFLVPVAGPVKAIPPANLKHYNRTVANLSDGSTLCSGGHAIMSSTQPEASCEAFQNNKWSYKANMNKARRFHKMILLKDNQMLAISGDYDAKLAFPAGTCELYDPKADRWEMTGSLNIAREYFTATLLDNGMVLVTGGKSISDGKLSTEDSVELYDPSTQKWIIAGNMPQKRSNHAAIKFLDGSILVTGGVDERAYKLSSVDIFIY